MADKDDLSSLTDAQLVAAYVENVQAYDAIEHVGAANRHFDHRIRIVDELKRRSAGTLQPLRGLLDHTDPNVRLTAAIRFRTVDHAAYERTVRALAKRKDTVGNDARESLRVDAHFQEVGYPELAKDAPHQPLPSRVRWQSEHLPPEPMTRAAIKALLADTIPDAAAPLMRLARPAIGLWPQRPDPDMPIGASRLGGMPYAPHGFQWPMADTEPMLFVGHINCSELHDLPGAERLSSSGLLAFFGDHDSVTGCLLTGRGVAVFHWPDINHLLPATPPIELMMVFPLCALVFRALIDLPDPFSTVVGDILTDEEQVSSYAAVRDAIRHYGIPDELHSDCGFGKLLGWPSLVQQDDLDVLGDAADPNDFRLLLQLDQYSNGEELEGWGPGGSLYFVMRDCDLRQGRFDRCEFDMQCT